jgi:hypothetical protein
MTLLSRCAAALITGMPIYVAEISGRALAAMNAETTFTAEDWFGGPAFHRELTLLLDEDGNPLWDGEAEIHVRAANSVEEEIWKRERAAAVTGGIVDEDDAKVLVFLINVFDLDVRRHGALN